ncbi:MAG: HDOD domain-containing protein [Gammaproteobacteria bacterium]|nr:HDOD domain-containing protein [Gammaproteobacteria bacterium]
MSALIETVQSELLTAIDNDELILPTLPEVALQVREAAEDPDVGLNELSKVISNDAALTARIIKVVNSPLLRSSSEISDLNMAVNRLGMSYTANLAMGLAMEQMFQATSDVIDRRLRDVWATSTEVAGISHVLCRHFTRLKPDQAALAGLVHQIGILPILSYAEEHGQLLSDSFTLEQVIERLHPVLGQRILQAWDFPPGLINVPMEYLDFERHTDTVDYVDIVQVALLQLYAGNEHPLGQIDWTRVDAFRKLGLEVSEQSLEADEDLTASMEAATKMLQA